MTSNKTTETGGRAPRRNRRDLSPQRIVIEALRLIDSEGLEGFSFRTLARGLHCEAMSIYHWFPSKQHLFDALVEHCIAEMKPLDPATSWQERFRHVCDQFRGVALRHPGFFLYFGLYRMNSRAGLALLDQVLRTMEESGLSEERVARLFRAVGYYLVGAGLDEAMGYAKGPSAAEPMPDADVAREFPAVVRAGKFFGKDHHQQTFETGLNILLQQIFDEAEKRREP